MEKYDVLGLIGEGSFGRVYKAKCLRTEEIVAFKIIRKRGRSEKELRSLRQEFEIQQHLHHPNIIQMLDSFETENEIVVVTEYAEKELYEILGEEGYLPEDRVHKIVCDLVSALYYLHSHRVLHRDLKPQNILIEASGVAKLCDFGFARSMSTGTYVLTSIKGTPLYMAPELIEEKPYDHNADLWSLGCIVYELLVGTPPFCTSSILHLVRLIRHEAVKWPDFISPMCQSFIQGLLQKDPRQRLTWPLLLEHPFVQNGVLILKDEGTATPLTNPLTASQAAAKEIQKQDLVTQTADQSKIFYRAVQKIEEHEEKKLKLLQQRNRSVSDVSAAKCCESAKESLVLGGNRWPHYKSLRTRSCNVTGCSSDAVCIGEKNKLNKSSSDPYVIVPVNSQNALQSVSKLHYANGRSYVSLRGTQNKRSVSLSNEVSFATASVAGHFDGLIIDGVKNACDNGLSSQSNLKSVNSDVEKMEPTGLTSDLGHECSVVKFKPKQLSSICQSHGLFTLHSWNSSVSTHPIESDEWLAFLQRTMEEVMDGDVEAILQCSFVGVVVSPLRNSGASCRVVEYVACLLSLPFVVNNVSEEEVSEIQKIVTWVVGPCIVLQVDTSVFGDTDCTHSDPEDGGSMIFRNIYLEVKVVPNLVYASKLLAHQKDNNSDDNDNPSQSFSGNLLRPVSDLSADELQALECICLLLCHLTHADEDFLIQFCDAVAILNATSLLQQFLLLGRRKVRVVTDLVAILSHVLRVLPENAGLIEQIVLGMDTVGCCAIDLTRMLTHHSPVLRARTCILLQLLSRYSCRALQLNWTQRLQEDLESLVHDSNKMVQVAAKGAIKEIKELQFYFQKK